MTDPAAVAAEIRSLALEARRVLGDPDRHPYELHVLVQRVASLQDGLPASQSSELARWVDSLLRKVEEEQEFESRKRCGKARPAAVGAA